MHWQWSCETFPCARGENRPVRHRTLVGHPVSPRRSKTPSGDGRVCMQRNKGEAVYRCRVAITYAQSAPRSQDVSRARSCRSRERLDMYDSDCYFCRAPSSIRSRVYDVRRGSAEAEEEEAFALQRRPWDARTDAASP